mgnify:CR=1 FL=1
MLYEFQVVIGEIGQPIADSSSTDGGELALGQNLTVAFMSWGGYNYEDAIILNQNLVKKDKFTSVHIEKFEIEARETKLGNEEITRDIPNVGEDTLLNLDEDGIIQVGASVKPGDILVGKITPKGETELTSEEKLLRAIFGEKASDVRDTSLKVPPGVSGTIVDVRVFSRRGIEKDERARAIERAEIDRFAKDRDDEKLILEKGYYGRLAEFLVGQKVDNSSLKKLKNGEILSEEIINDLSRTELRSISVDNEKVQKKLEKLSNKDTLEEYDSSNQMKILKFY